MKQKHIDAMRELRLWLVQVIAPIGLGATALYINNQTFQDYVNRKIEKFSAKRPFRKK